MKKNNRAFDYSHYETWMDPNDLIPYAKNAKQHDREQVKNIANSIRRFGWQQEAVVTQDNVLVIGHGRRLAAISLKCKMPVKVIDQKSDQLTDEDIRELRIADNKTNESPWDFELLADEIADLDFDGFDFDFQMPELEDDRELVEEDDYDKPLPENPVSKEGDIWQLGRHRLMCGDSTNVLAVEKLMGGKQADLLVTDPPYNVDYQGGTVDKMKIQNDNMGDAEFQNFLHEAFFCADQVMKPGAAFYIWHADSEGYNFRTACKQTGWTVRQCLIWNKNSLVMGRQDYQWKHEPCQPAGTMVMTPEGQKPIETLTESDRVVSYYTMQNELRGLRDGTEIKTASRHYKGTLYGVLVDGKQTWATNNHEFSIKFNPDTANTWCTYLMRRGNWWRVGCTRTYDARGFGLKHRVDQEKAEEAWIIETFENQADAQIGEQLLAISHGIPYTYWETRDGMNEKYTMRTREQIEHLYNQMDLKAMKDRAEELLRIYGRDPAFPLVSKENKAACFSRRVTARIHACNLIPELMMAPVVKKGNDVVFWPIEWIDHREHDGPVFSLAVRYYQHYVADGIVTHNCLYGWKDGAGHTWNSDRKQTTVLDFDRPKKNDIHPTMKPIGLFDYLIQNSSKHGDIVLDTFGGSGTAIMACEQDGRDCYTMELDPRYVDAIIDRWETFTGEKAILINGEEEEHV